MNYTRITLIASSAVLLVSCGKDIEEIKNPSTGKLLKRFEYYTDDSGQKLKDGEYFEWDAAGNKIAELNYQADSLNGSCIFYNKDGTTDNYNYLIGKVHGEQTKKSKNGNWVFKENFSNGILDGLQTYYHLTGKIQCTGSYTLGKQTGTWKYFDDDGKSAFNLTFKNGVCQELIGTWIKENGVTTFTFQKNGTFILKAPYFRYSREAVIQGEGPFSVSRMLKLSDETRGDIWEYEVFEVEKNRLILINPNAEAAEAILDLRRKNATNYLDLKSNMN